MQYRELGRTGLKVSALGLGTMTFGEQNTERQAHAQLDRALAAGINFLDTAEMYPTPPRPETQGRTEQYIGSWLAARGGGGTVWSWLRRFPVPPTGCPICVAARPVWIGPISRRPWRQA